MYLEQEILHFFRNGICLPFQTRDHEPTPCDLLYESGVDYVYVPWNRVNGDYYELMFAVFEYGSIFQLFFGDLECTESALHLFCQYYLPPCGNSTHFEPPAALCPSACHIPSLLCPDAWANVVNVYETNIDIVNMDNLHLINCSDTGEHLHPVPHCCHDAGINTSELS